ncbi:hypothetical protein A3844_28455 [Paenibacillus helianthi]|uniref:Type II secretion system protein GspF domain-containing protein n=1 Tax=Paenibacillus helianthi TaxID=1349432 RepID=A0ABX3EGU5_9BACL|nr:MULTISPECIES: hypothetical protein [Paenibacillus]OKP79465.1 hypothetical protein A3844_28455 [Paenibacillus helianthi]OKP91432.1 hypothetical protein A3848_10035 [Paenibacillus sp. P32E]
MELLFYVLQVAFHLLIAGGLWLLVKPLIERHLRQLGQKIDQRMSLRISLFGKRVSSNKKRRWLYRHLDDLLYFAKRKYEPGISVTRFLIHTLFLFSAVFLSGMLTLSELPGHLSFSNPFLEGISFDERIPVQGNWRFPLFVAVIAASIPYLRTRYLYAQRKVRGSYDLLDVIKIATKFTHLSVDSILTKTAEFLTEESVLKTPLRLLGAAFSNYSNERELTREAERFAGAIGTTFAVEFVSDLLYCEKEGTRYLKNTLMMLSRSMEQQRETILTVKAGSRDAISLGLYGNLVVLVSSVGTFIYMLKPDVYFKLQFQTTVGLTFLMIIIAGLFISFMISTILARPKLDYH